MLLSIVFPVFDEEEVLPALFPAIRGVLESIDCDYELVFVNDGSRDRTLEILHEEAAADGRVKVVHFARNFGHQLAITAGLDLASGDAVVVMDADLQDPPEIVIEMVNLYRQGYDVVSAQRVSREGDSWFKRKTAEMFYRLMRRAVDERLVPEVGDFRLFSRRAVTALRQFREEHRFLRGLVAWLGLKEAILPFHRQRRAAGTTKYPLWKMMRFAWTAISSFSAFPLRMAIVFGIVLTLAGFAYFGYVLVAKYILQVTVQGWTSLIGIQIGFSGALLVAIGLLGDYVAKIYEEIKQRPLYVVSQTWNVPPPSVPRAVILDDAAGRERPGPEGARE